MKPPFFLVFAALSLSSAAALAADPVPSPSQGESNLEGSVSFVAGQKTLHKNDWDHIDTQYAAGIVSTWGLKGLPFSVAVDGNYSSGSDSQIGA